jgi:Spy/CpxP family protein refolding chaperone
MEVFVVRNLLSGSLLALALTCSIAALPASAQDTQPTSQATMPDRAERTLNLLSERLSLTDQEKDQIKPILEDRQQRFQELRSESGRPRKKKKEAQEILKDTDGKIKGVLTADQWTQYRQFEKQMQEQMKEHRQQQ